MKDPVGSIWVTGRHPVEELLVSTTQRARKVLLSDAIRRGADYLVVGRPITKAADPAAAARAIAASMRDAFTKGERS